MTQNIKKSRILNENLPTLSTKDSFFGYRIRYRIVSEDRNKFSAWSPIYNLSAENLITGIRSRTTSNISASAVKNSSNVKTGTLARLSWTPPTDLTIYNFDIFAKIKTTQSISPQYVWYRATSTTSYDIIIPSTFLDDTGVVNDVISVDFLVQIASSTHKENLSLQMFEILGFDVTAIV